MPQPFVSEVDVINAVKSILDHYPLVDGPLRELIQNSDDAGATKQIFAIDRRRHSISSLTNAQYIASQQSPSLIAYNDAYFEDNDWSSLQNIFDSSKAKDPATFGQFGQGFRCVYHLTDCPQVFSGSKLALLDLPAGTILDMTNPSDADYTSHIAPFRGLPNIPCHPLPSAINTNLKGKGKLDCPRMDGTAIRLPLRSRSSSLSTKCPKPEDIMKLFDEFVRHDLECVLLFLRNVKEIAIYEIISDEDIREICWAAIDERVASDVMKSGGTTSGTKLNYSTRRTIIETRVSTLKLQTPGFSNLDMSTSINVSTGGATSTETKTTKTTWRVLNCPFTDESSLRILGQLSDEYKPDEEMTRRKLHQRVQVAAPLSIIASAISPTSILSPLTTPSSTQPLHAPNDPVVPTSYGVNHWRHGRFFSGLPLPRFNNRLWPIHVDARFALPPSRQFIRSFHEGGFVGEWNMTLFTAFVPQAWTFLLNVLAHEDRVKDIFAYWPPPSSTHDHAMPIMNTAHAGIGASSTGSGSVKSQGTLQIVFNCVIEAKATVWPIYVAPNSHSPPSTPVSAPLKTTGSTAAREIAGQSRPTLATTPTIPLAPPLPQFSDLSHLKVAREDVHLDLRNTLAECGVKFTQPPAHFKTLIEGYSSLMTHFLEPRKVYEDLVDNMSRLEKVITENEKHATNLVDFFLKAQDVHLLAGLPLLKNVDGQLIKLEHLQPTHSTKQTLHILFDAQSTPLFKAYDSDAIGLQDLKFATANFIRKNAPGVLNVAELTAEKVADYLSTDNRWTSPISLPLTSSTTLSSPITQETMQWLLKFFMWISGQSFAGEIFPILEDRQLQLLPTQLGLRKVGSIVVDPSNVTPALAKCLRALDVPLLERVVVPTLSKLQLGTGNRLLRKVEDIQSVLEVARPELSADLTCLQWRELINHIVRYTETEQRLTQEQTKKLRSLPIYPIISFADASCAVPQPTPGPIPEGKPIYAVLSVEILPIIDGCVILDFQGWPPRLYEIIRLLDPSSPNVRPLAPMELLQLGVQNFGSQPPEIRSSIVNYAATNERTILRESLEKLLAMSFVACRDGVARKPEEVVDVESMSTLSDIILTCTGAEQGPTPFDSYLPRVVTDSDKEIIQGLRKFRVSPFLTALDQYLTIQISSWLSNNTDHPDAILTSKKLFSILVSNPACAEFVTAIPSDVKWIATGSGLKGKLHCRDRNAHSAIFDDVYALVDEGIQVTDVLRQYLGWSEKISLNELISQFEAILRRGGDYARVRDIVQLVSSQTISDLDLSRLCRILENKCWVPTKTGGLAKTKDAVIAHGISDARIFDVSFDEIAYPHVIEFLKRMGIADRPTTNMILDRFDEYRSSSLTTNQLKPVVDLLNALPDELSDESKSRILLPDMEGIMRPISGLYSNDTGTRITRLPSNQKTIMHDVVPEHLARKFGVEPLAIHYSRFSNYMGESFVTSIRNAITEYTETQTLVEMLANAIDAGARRFIVVLDEMPQPAEHLISPGLVSFQQCPALLVFNDASFTEEDFKGLCNTGEGSKKQKDNTIGQFGRGALTMFHFTECPSLISHHAAMFIDPTRKHLSDLPSNDNNQRLEIQQLRSFYPDHLGFLTSLADLLRFDGNDIESFTGTIFRLPLRTQAHINHASPLSATIWTPLDIQEKIIPAFKELARDCFLFTSLECIQVHVRNCDGHLRELWGYDVQRSQVTARGQFEFSMIEILESTLERQLWQTASWTIPENAIPPFALTLIEQQRTRRLKRPKVALAAYIRPPDADYQDYHQPTHLFSTLPITEPTGLPVYCSATFVLSSDRRHVRLDNDPGHQSRYNKWLLEDLVPPLYLSLLEDLAQMGVSHHHFWPVNGRAPADSIVVDTLYSRHLRNTNRHLFTSAFDPECHLTPAEVKILDKGSSVQSVIEFLQPRNVIICSEPFLSCIKEAELSHVSPHFFKEQISLDPHRFLAGFSMSEEGRAKLTLDDLTQLLKFFLDYDPEQLIGLRLLPLQNGDFGTFAAQPAQATYYVWKNDDVPNETFANPNHLVMSDFDVDMLLGKGFNVEKLSSSSLAVLIGEKFPKRPYIDVSQNPDARIFIDTFWANFDRLQLRLDDILEFPLVPKLLTSEYISLASCKFGDVPIIPNRVDNLACQCLVALGVPMVRLSSAGFPPPLSSILDDHSFVSEFKMRDILKAFENIQPEILIESFFRDLSDTDREAFSDWIRRQLFLDVPEELQEVAKSLPVWSACDSEGIYHYIPASELILLPETLDETIVAPYVTNGHKIVLIPQGQNDILRPNLKRKLGVEELSFRELLRIISSGLPTNMIDRTERSSYKRLVEAILERIEPPLDALHELKLPNAYDFSLQPVWEFYAREESIFQAAYPGTSPKFVSSEFEDMEGRLPHLKRTAELTMDIFADCVELIASARNMAGAATAFDLLNGHLPLLLSALGSDADRWDLIENIQFIPRMSGILERVGPVNAEGESDVLDVSRYVDREFGSLVSPREIVRKDYEGIAWSQRARPSRGLNEGLLRAYPGLGRPSTDEVVLHLRVLASQVSRDYPNHPVVLSDIVATYQYLNERTEECAAQLTALRDQPLFLNVDDPQAPGTTWVWHSASSISFDILDVGSFRSARRFLQRYRLLLVAAGAIEVSHPSSRDTAHATPSSDTLTHIRRKYAEMRGKKQLVDVSFVSRDHDERRKLLGHKSFLAAHSNYLWTAFCNDPGESRPSSSKNLMKLNVTDYSRSCVSVVLDYVYSGLVSNLVPLDELLDGLRLAKVWELADLIELLQDCIIDRRLLNPSTLNQIENVATQGGFTRLVACCDEYKGRNNQYITRAVER